MATRSTALPSRVPQPASAHDEAGDFDIANYVPYLINRSATALYGPFTRELEPHDITLPMWRIMAILYRRGALRFGALAALGSMEPPTLSRVVAQLLDQGLVTKQRSDRDARGVLIDITVPGRRIVEAIIPRALAMERDLLATFSADEAYLLRRLLQRFCDVVAPSRPFEGSDPEPDTEKTAPPTI